MKTLLLIFLLFLCLSVERVSGQAQVPTDNNIKYENGLGVAAGWTIGYGLSYRFQPDKFGAQITFFPYKDSQTTQYSAGLTFLYKLVETNDKKINGFVYQSNAFFYTKNNPYYEEVYNYDNYNYYSIYIPVSTKNWFNDGVGIGVEYNAFNWFDIDIMGGYAFYQNFSQYHFTGETCLLFKF